MESDTTTRLDYKRWNLEPVYKKAGEEWRPPTNQMENNTSYSTEFTHRASERANLIKPKPRDRLHAKFESDTTYKNDYMNLPGEKRGMLKAKGEYQLPVDASFDGSSTYKGHYVLPAQMDKVMSFKPNNQFKPPEAPFEAVTLYSTDFGYVKA